MAVSRGMKSGGRADRWGQCTSLEVLAKRLRAFSPRGTIGGVKEALRVIVLRAFQTYDGTNLLHC